MFERSGHCSIASVGYEPHPDFYSFCQVVGHLLHICHPKKRDGPNDKKDDTSNNNKPPPPNGPSGTQTQKKWTKKDDPPEPSNTVNQEPQNPTHVDNSYVDTSYVVVGDRHFKFDSLPFYTMTSGAMQCSGFDFPSLSQHSPDPQIIGGDSSPRRSHTPT